MRLDHKRTDKFKKKEKKRNNTSYTLLHYIQNKNFFFYSLEFLIMRLGDKRTSFQKKKQYLKHYF